MADRCLSVDIGLGAARAAIQASRLARSTGDQFQIAVVLITASS
jgi:hypothetical protein